MTTTATTRATTTAVTDRALQQQIEEEFVWDPAVSPARIGVSVVDHAATLTGTVDTLAARLAAVRAAKRVKGVRAIADDIVVHTDGAPARSDQDVARFVEEALEWNTQVPEAVRATVRDGIVTLEGTVDWNFQRRAAERVVQQLSGVRYVANKISLKRSPSPREVHRVITAALHRHADLDAHSIEVESKGGEVWLRGTVSNWAERERAEAAAWAAPGVTAVHDDLRLR